MDTRIVDPVTEVRETIDRALLRVNTCIPGVVDSFDPATQTCTVRPAIQMRVNIDGSTSFMDLPQIINAPLIFPFAITAGFALTLPVKAGDACVILFSQRSIDNWHDKGGVQPPEDGVSTRHHDLTDALVLLTAVPTPDVLSGWVEDGIEIRNTAQNSRITLRDASIEIARGTSLAVMTDTGVTITTTDIVATAATVVVDSPDTTFTGLVKIGANLEVTGTVKNNSVNIGSTHIHSQTNDSAGDVEADTGAPH